VNTVRDEIMPLQSEGNLIAVRQAVRAWMVPEEFNILEQTKMVTAVSELARNAIVHGGGGDARLELLTDAARRGIRVTIMDHGVGIEDIAIAMVDGHSTGSGLGLGLSGAKRLVDEFNIWSEPGQGTRIEITRWKK
jgi:serine/threonine-protein kinase RsbT